MTHDRAPLDAARALLEQGARGVLLFDSGRALAREDDSPRWSILLHDPVCVLTWRAGAFVELDARGQVTRRVEEPVAWLIEHARSATPLAPRFDEAGERLPFVSGLAGFLGFGFARYLDAISLEREGNDEVPLLWVGQYESAQTFRHLSFESSVASQAAESHRVPVVMSTDARLEGMPQEDAKFWYEARVEACIAAIVERGDLFEVNYTERFRAPRAGVPPLELYERLRAHATGDYMGYMDLGEVQLASISPEQFLSCRDGELMTRPIKGTARRDMQDEARDAELGRALRNSQKDRSENIMIVDLMRNDLTRVSRLGSVRATALCELESFAGVHHLVSTVRGELDEGVTPIEALLSSFPAGSITGAPKLRAMEYITAYEASARAAYTGSMFYVSECGQMDSNVLIRTVEIIGEVMRYGAGGAVVSDSEPESEWHEALLKAEPFFRAAASSAAQEE